jgi:hypothetical protein
MYDECFVSRALGREGGVSLSTCSKILGHLYEYEYDPYSRISPDLPG